MSNHIRAEFLTFRPVGGSAITFVGLGALGLAITLSLVLYKLTTEGHSSFGTSYEVPWGLPIATYVFFVLTSTGLTFVASLAMVFGFKQLYPITKRCIWLAIATLAAGFTALALELGHPFRLLWEVPTGFQYRSPMFWMGVFYSIYFGLLLLKFLTVHLNDWNSPLSRSLGIASFVSVVLAHGNLGMLFGMMAMRPFWYDGLNFLYFLATAALSGVAFTVLFSYLTFGTGRANMPAAVRPLMSNLVPNLFAAALGIVIIFIGARTWNGLWSNLEGLETFYHTLQSPLFHFEIWVGLVLPFIVLLFPALRQRTGMLLACSVLVILALLIGRYEYVIGGQLVPVFRGVAFPGFAEYTPTYVEWSVFLIAVSVTLLIYGAGEWLLRLGDTPEQVSEQTR